MKEIVKKMMILFMWYPLRVVVKYFPLKVMYLMGVAGGYMLYFISKDKQKIMAEELSLIMPDKTFFEIKKIIKDSFVNYAISELEVLLYPIMDEAFIAKTVTIIGREHLDNALLSGRGVLLFQSHFGAFQMVMPAIGYSGYTMNQISASASVWKEGMTSAILRRSFDKKSRLEYVLPVTHISVTSTLRPAFQALRRNEIVGITVDGGGGRKTISIRFLGRNANFQQGAADLALRTGSEIVPVFIITGKDLTHTLIIHPSLYIDEALDKRESMEKIMKEFAMILETYVCQYPSHYGYTLFLRKSRASQDPSPFFEDHEPKIDYTISNEMKVDTHV